jgi:hypothetical protein
MLRIRIRVRRFFDPWILDPDPGWKKVQIQVSRITSRILFLRTSYQFFGLKILKLFDAEPGSCQPWIRDKHPGSATLVKVRLCSAPVSKTSVRTLAEFSSLSLA